VSEFDDCVDDSCRVRKSVSGVVGSGLSDFCFNIISPIDGSTAEQVSINVARSHSDFVLSDCYYADDPVFDCSVSCSCPGSAAPECTTASSLLKFRNVVYNFKGIHRDKICALGVFGSSGRFCGVCGISILPRFHVCRITPNPVVSTELHITRNNNTVSISVSQASAHSLEIMSNVFLRVQSHVYDTRRDAEYVVYDTHNMNDFYLLSSSIVNGRHEVNRAKFGFYKTDTQYLDKDLPLRFSVTDCHKSVFSVNDTSVKNEDVLESNKHRQSHIAAPHSVLVTADNIFTFKEANTNHDSAVTRTVSWSPPCDTNMGDDLCIGVALHGSYSASGGVIRGITCPDRSWPYLIPAEEQDISEYHPKTSHFIVCSIQFQAINSSISIAIVHAVVITDIVNPAQVQTGS